MANWSYTSFRLYRADGSEQQRDDTDGTLSTPDTDDGFWNPGDTWPVDVSYKGSFESASETFLVFETIDGKTYIFSDVYEAAHAAYPATY